MANRKTEAQLASKRDKAAKLRVRHNKKGLTISERKIYDAVMSAFPATHPDSAYDIAVQGGVRWDFKPI
jgi:hypothetical protein